ncbi:Eco57I restriction-modification methylase domain-containing protein [Candidatus Woesearchaeota archaeon]|nr:Eco57I restriction-modification methylase domain-containing protein [Candidatus Woesearchaeota archaeon]
MNENGVHTKLRKALQRHINELKSPADIYNLFRIINYPEKVIFDTTSKRKKSAFDFKKEDEQRIKEIYSVLSFDENLPVFLLEVSTLTSSFIRSVTNTLDKQYLQFLLIFSSDYSELVFVFPDREKAEAGKHKLKLTRLILNKNEIRYTDIQTLSDICYDGEDNWRDIWRKWKKAFSVERVTENFFEDYKNIFFALRNELHKQNVPRKESHEFTLQFLNRIMFIYFISKKKWLEYPRFIEWVWGSYKKLNKYGSDEFYEKWLRQIFFKAFNNRSNELTGLPNDVLKAISGSPYLNGGLFRQNDLDNLKIKMNDKMFQRIFEFFEKYNFTIKEDMPLESEVAVDPQMIGYVYESLAYVGDEIYDRNDLGIFYTPRIEVDFMCKRSLVEYLSKSLPEVPKEKFYHLIFDLPEEKDKIEKWFAKEKMWRKLEGTLDNLSVIDPACGSGAFLVGMLNVVAEVYRIINKHTNRTLTDFQLKNRIIQYSLYGVDVMPWAIHAAELRLWLQLIVETEFKKDELRKNPLLPNLNLNLRIGDSLVQEIGGINFNLRANNLKPHLKKKLENLKQEKRKYFENSPNAKFKTPEEVKAEEIKLFEEIIDERVESLGTDIEVLKNDIKRSGKQTSLFGETKGDVEILAKDRQKREEKEREIQKCHEEIEKLKKIKVLLRDPEKKPFVWDIDFAEIFSEKNGFDIVIGNPPYVRQEMISPPNKMKSEVTLEDRKEYKEKLINSVKNLFSVIDDLNRKSDYYIYFYFHGLGLLNKTGTFCFITSNSWLDVGYGKNLQEFLCKYVPVTAIYDNPKRSFAHADVNTIIALFGAPEVRQRSLGDWVSGMNGGNETIWPNIKHTAKFVMFKKPFEEVLSAKNLIEIEEAKATIKRQEIIELVKNVLKTDDYRVFPIIQEDLLEDGWEYPESYKNGRFRAGSYEGNKWGGKYIRAPDIFYTILEKGKNKVIILGKITSKTRRNTLQNFGNIIEEKENYSRNNNYPYLSSVKDIETIKVDIRSLPISIKRTTKKPIEYPIVDVISNRFLGERLFFIEGGNFVISDTFFVGFLKKNYNKEDVVALLNSSLSLCLTEIIGRKNLGGGLLTIYGPEMKNLILLDSNKLSNNAKDKINLIYKKISRRPIKPIFEELGINPVKPIREQEPKPLADRAELDKIIFDELGLTKEERKEVYWSVCELVKQRLEKARSLRD